jgi:hypothetical protein
MLFIYLFIYLLTLPKSNCRFQFWMLQSENVRTAAIEHQKDKHYLGGGPPDPTIFFTNHLRKAYPQQNVCRIQTNSDYDMIQINPNTCAPGLSHGIVIPTSSTGRRREGTRALILRRVRRKQI